MTALNNALCIENAVQGKDRKPTRTLPEPVAYSTDPPTDVSLASTLKGPKVPSDVSLYANCMVVTTSEHMV